MQNNQQHNYAHMQKNEVSPMSYIGGFINRRPTQIRAKTEDLDEISYLQQFPSPNYMQQKQQKQMLQDNIFYRDINQYQEIEPIPIAQAKSQERGTAVGVRTKRHIIKDKGETKHESVRVNRDNQGKINVIIDIPTNDESKFNSTGIFTATSQPQYPPKNDQPYKQHQFYEQQIAQQYGTAHNFFINHDNSSKQNQNHHSKKTSINDKKQTRMHAQLNNLNQKSNDYYKLLEQHMIGKQIQQNVIPVHHMGTPDISSGTFLMKDVQNFTDMSFDQLNQTEATNFLYQALFQNQTQTNLDKHLNEANKQIEQDEIMKTQNSLETQEGSTVQKSRKGFRIKFKGNVPPIALHGLNQTQDTIQMENSLTPNDLSAKRVAVTKRDASQPRSALDKLPSPIDAQHNSLVEQIRKKFSEQKYMNREDVLKLLKQIQNSEHFNKDKGRKREVFDQSEIFRGIHSFNPNEVKLFNMTNQQQQFMHLFKKETKTKKPQVPSSSQNNHRKTPPRNDRNDDPPTQVIPSNRLKLGLTTNFIPRIRDDRLTQQNEPQRNHTSLGQQRFHGSIEDANSTTGGEGTRVIHISPVKVYKSKGEEFITSECDFEIVVPANIDEESFINDIDEEKVSTMMKIGLRSLKKFENKTQHNSGGPNMPHQGVARRVRHLQNAQASGAAFLNALSAYSLARGIDPREASILIDMIKADKYGLLTNDVNQLKKDLQEYYLLEKLAKGCVSKQMPLQVRYQLPNPAGKYQKSLTAAGMPRKERKPMILVNNNIQNKMPREESFSELKQLSGIIDGCHQNNHANMADTKIKVLLQPYTHLENTEINRVIKHINHFVFLVFKQRAKLSDNQYVQLFRFFGINPPKINGIVDQQAFKNREFMNQSNEKLLQRLFKVLNKENGNIEPVIGKSNLNYYVGKGNNFYLVRQIIKRRVWWTRASKEDFSVIMRESEEGNNHYGCNFIWTQWKKSKHLTYLKKNSTTTQNEEGINIKLYNRLESNYHLSNKKALFRNIQQYYHNRDQDPFELAIPLTFHIKHMNASDQDYQAFLKIFNELKAKKDSQNVWIVKPGEDTNRGCGIHVSNSLNEIQQILKSELKKRTRTMIVQKYIEKPLLVNGRKFDIRCYGLMTSINGYQKGFFYRDCYFRTSSKEYSIDNLSNKYIHLTNDAIQKNAEDYGKFENGNKMSINDFQRYLDSHYAHLNISFMRDLFSQIERLVTDTYRAVYSKIDANRVKNSFELFGYDFMIDDSFRVYLIEANTNPCLEISCPLLARIIPEVIDNTFTMVLDPLFQPGQFENQQDPQVALMRSNTTQQQKKRSRRVDLLPQIKYQMVFDEKIDGPELKEVLKAHQGDPFNDPLLMGIDEDDDDIDGKGSIGDDDEEDDEDSDNNPFYK